MWTPVALWVEDSTVGGTDPRIDGFEFRGSFALEGLKNVPVRGNCRSGCLLQLTSSTPEECALALDIRSTTPFSVQAEFTHVNLAGRRPYSPRAWYREVFNL